jgi:hypothetical protein
MNVLRAWLYIVSSKWLVIDWHPEIPAGTDDEDPIERTAWVASVHWTMPGAVREVWRINERRTQDPFVYVLPAWLWPGDN